MGKKVLGTVECHEAHAYWHSPDDELELVLVDIPYFNFENLKVEVWR
jgi:hypothetical protein